MTMAELFADLRGQPWDLVLRLLSAGLFGGLIGAERERADQAAGLRTNILVAMAACLFTLISIFGFTSAGAYDQSRIVSQIVSGIGFLGAGALFRDQDHVRGLTTAASIWMVAAIGVATGAGLYFLATMGTLIALGVLILLQPLSASLSPSRKEKR